MGTGLFRIRNWVQVAFENGIELPVTDQHYRAAGYAPCLDELPLEQEQQQVTPAAGGVVRCSPATRRGTLKQG